MRKKNFLKNCILLSGALLLLNGCGDGSSSGSNPGKVTTANGGTTVSVSESIPEDAPLRKAVVLSTKTDGSEVYEEAGVTLDLSASSEGYLVISYEGEAEKARVLMTEPSGATYNYLLPAGGEQAVYPFSEGSGTYQIGVYENVYDDQYALVYEKEYTVNAIDDYHMFLYPNAYVNFDENSKAVAKGEEVARGLEQELDVVAAVYSFVTGNITYDYDKAATVQTGYLPTVDNTLRDGKGICFDFASLMATMLRSQQIPTKLVIGYCDDQYHAWISVYTKEEGWIDDIIVFDGKEWTLMDPTLISYAKRETVEKYMNDTDGHYTVKYVY